MEFLPREMIVDRMNQSLDEMIAKYDLEDIGVFEEQGEEDQYHIGYTIRKDGEVFMVHKPFVQNESGELAATDQDWVIETDTGDASGFTSLDDVFSEMNGQH